MVRPVAEQAGVDPAWLETQTTGFLVFGAQLIWLLSVFLSACFNFQLVSIESSLVRIINDKQ